MRRGEPWLPEQEQPQKSGDQKNGGKKNDESGASGSRDEGASKATTTSPDDANAKKGGEAGVEASKSREGKSGDSDEAGLRAGGDRKRKDDTCKDDARLGGAQDAGKSRGRSEDAVSRFDPSFCVCCSVFCPSLLIAACI